MIPFPQEEAAGAVPSCSVGSARPGQVVLGGILQITTALNTSHDVSTKEKFRCSFITLSAPPDVFGALVLGLLAPVGSSSSFPVSVFQAEHGNANRPEASPATAALFLLLDQSGCWWRLLVPVALQDSCSSQPEGASGPVTVTTTAICPE